MNSACYISPEMGQQLDKYHLLLETARTDDLAQQISLYRNSLAKHGHDPRMEK